MVIKHMLDGYVPVDCHKARFETFWNFYLNLFWQLYHTRERRDVPLTKSTEVGLEYGA